MNVFISAIICGLVQMLLHKLWDVYQASETMGPQARKSEHAQP